MSALLLSNPFVVPPMPPPGPITGDMPVPLIGAVSATVGGQISQRQAGPPFEVRKQAGQTDPRKADVSDAGISDASRKSVVTAQAARETEGSAAVTPQELAQMGRNMPEAELPDPVPVSPLLLWMSGRS